MTTYSRRGPDPLEQGLDRLVTAGKHLVDGVSGARPGTRAAGRRSANLPRLDELGRWVEDRLDWILEDEDDWREPWQEEPLQPARRSGRRPLEAISLRGSRSSSTAQPVSPAQPGHDDWPEDDAFAVSRWQRPVQANRPPLEPGRPAAGRPLPRSTRRRLDS